MKSVPEETLINRLLKNDRGGSSAVLRSACSLTDLFDMCAAARHPSLRSGPPRRGVLRGRIAQGLFVTGLSLLILSSLVASAPAWAERADRDRPVQIEANAMQLDQARQVAIYEGNVVLTQGTLLLTADRLAIRQDAAGFQSGEASGRPVRFRQKVDGQDLYVEGQANRIEYDARAETVRLIGEARLKRGQDDLRGHLITYNTASQVYQAQGAGPGSEGGRVRAVIQPRSRPGEGSGAP